MDLQQSNDRPNSNEKKVVVEPKKETWWDIIRFALITLAVVIPIRMYIAQPFIVSGLSMFPTFNDKEYLIVDEISYRFTPPARGDVIIFRFPEDQSKFFIKRIIGLPGEKVTISEGKVYITKDGKKTLLDEPYIKEQTTKNSQTELSSDQYFVMGDNRAVSYDSRYWGPLNVSFIRGRALVRLFPPNKISYQPGEFNNYQLTK